MQGIFHEKGDLGLLINYAKRERKERRGIINETYRGNCNVIFKNIIILNYLTLSIQKVHIPYAVLIENHLISLDSEPQTRLDPDLLTGLPTPRENQHLGNVPDFLRHGRLCDSNRAAASFKVLACGFHAAVYGLKGSPLVAFSSMAHLFPMHFTLHK